MIFISSTVPFDQIHDTYKESQTSGRNYWLWQRSYQRKYFIFGEKDIEKMFDSFRENNFKKNHICKYVLGNEIKKLKFNRE